MTDFPPQRLDRDELAFLAGSIFVETAQALLARRKPPTPFGSLMHLVREARRGRMTDPRALIEIAGAAQAGVHLNLLRRFDRPLKDMSLRYAAGLALLSAANTAGGLTAASLVLLRNRHRQTPVRRAPRPAGRLKPEKTRHAGARPVDVLKLIEPWDHDAPPPKGVTDGLASAGDTVGADRRDAPAFLIEDELAEEAPATRTAPDLGLDAHLIDIALPQIAVDWLRGLGFENSGVRIEPFAERLIGMLSRIELGRLLTMRRQRDGDRLALGVLETALRGKELRPGEELYLRRLASVLRCIHEGYRLPPRRTAPAYEPVPGSLLYLVHMRDPYEANGYVSRTHLILAAMQSAGFKPVAVTRLGFPNDLARHRNAAIADTHLMEGVPALSLPDRQNGQIGRPIINYIDAYAARVADLARIYRPALIHAASNHVNGLAAIKAARMLGVPSLYEVRGIWEITQASANEAYGGTLRYELQRRLENEAVASADAVITISEPLRRFVIQHGAASAKVSVVPNGVDVDKMRPMHRNAEIARSVGISPEEVVIGYAGSVVRYEGLDYVLEAIDILKRERLGGFRFLLIGDGRELANLRSLAEALDVTDRCIFLGRVPRERIEGLYSIIDIVPLPRRSLPVTELVPPLKPFEAMAAGKAVIVSSVEAIAGTVIDGETGLIVEKDNVGALADALRRLISDPGLRGAMGRKAREWVAAERSVPALAEQMAAVYRSLEVNLPQA